MTIKTMSKFPFNYALLSGEKFNKIFGMPTGGTVGDVVDQVPAMNIKTLTTGSSTSSTVVLSGATSGSTTLQAEATAGTTTTTFPSVTGTSAMTSGANLYIADLYRSTAIQTANTNIVPATVTGLFGAVAVGTYRIRVVIYSTVAAGGGLVINLLLTTAVMGVGNFVATALSAASMTCAGATSVTSPIALYTGATSVPIGVVIEGTFTVTTAGTVTIQMCQGTSNASNSSVNVGSTMELTRIA